MVIYKCDICGEETEETNPKLSDFLYEFDNINRHICNLCAEKTYNFLTGGEGEDIVDLCKEQLIKLVKKKQ